MTSNPDLMPPELIYGCPFCHAPARSWCTTRNGEWAVTIHQARLKVSTP